MRRVSTWAHGALIIGACGFSPSQAVGDGGQTSDASETCGAPGTTACEGRVVRTCGPDHAWDLNADRTCDFTCSAGACVAASNVPLTDVATCTATAPALTPPSGATLSITNKGGTHIECSPSCGEPLVTRIDATKTYATPAPGLSLFCLAKLAILDATTLNVASMAPSEAIAFVVDGSVDVSGMIDFDGEGAGSGPDGGRGGPGGYAGAAQAENTGKPGAGPCPGNGGTTVGPSGLGDHYSGGGGGGAGNASVGGDGGDGSCVNGDHHGKGGTHGGLCGTAELIPLIGGSGGGAGGDATNNVHHGNPAGGGGGVVQISSRIEIAVAGSISARGGAGYGSPTIDGGGGAGAGGGILLEAPMLKITGSLNVDGGAGGLSKSGFGGSGASAGSVAGNGTTYTANGQGGAGGGGGGGRIRFGGANAACVSGVSPNASCTTGSLVIAP